VRHLLFIFYARDAAGVTYGLNYSNIGYVKPVEQIYVEGRVKSAGVFRRDAYSNGRIRGPGAVSVGAVVLENSDGALDSLRSTYSFDTMALSVHEVDPVTKQHASHPFLWMVMEQPIVERTEVTFVVRDRRQYAAAQQYMGLRYAGTNSGSPLSGIEGTANDLKGQPKPIVVGQVFNVTPNLVNTDRRIYQVSGMLPRGDSGGSATEGGFTTNFSITVYDKRAVLTRGADYTSQADMEANVPAGGQYRVWPARGCFRLGSAPVGRVTCDVTNPTSATATDIKLSNVASAFSALDAPLTSVDPNCGIYLDSDILTKDVYDHVLASLSLFDVYGTVPTGTSGLPGKWSTWLTLATSLSYTPSSAAEVFNVDTSNIVLDSLQPVIPQEDDRGLPVWQVTVNYKRNYTVMSDTDLAGVAAADAEFCKKQWRSAVAKDTSVKTQWSYARELVIDTCLVNESDAQAEADRLLALLKVQRDMFAFRIHGAAVRLQMPLQQYFQPGQRVKITFPRFGLSAGKTMLITSIQENLDEDLLDVTVWG